MFTALKSNLSLGLACLCAAHLWAARTEIPPPPVPSKDLAPAPFDVFNFDKDKLMEVPKHFKAIPLPESPEIRWEVERDFQAVSKPNSLVQIGKAKPGENFGLIVLEDRPLKAAELTVRFRILGGDEDQAAGILFRYQDERNYFVIRIDANEEDMVLYQVKKGKRKPLDTKSVIISPYLWHDLKVIFTEKTYTGMLDGEAVLGGKGDASPDTGLVGLWTKSDSQIAFDNFQVPR